MEQLLCQLIFGIKTNTTDFRADTTTAFSKQNVVENNKYRS